MICKLLGQGAYALLRFEVERCFPGGEATCQADMTSRFQINGTCPQIAQSGFHFTGRTESELHKRGGIPGLAKGGKQRADGWDNHDKAQQCTRISGGTKKIALLQRGIRSDKQG